MVHEIHPVPWEFSDLTKNHFVIPRVQRAYAWENKHIEKFLGDLVKTQQQKNGGGHYFGSFCTAKYDKGDTIILIDGQQRFTTTFLFLYCAKSFVKPPFTHRIQEIVTGNRLKLGRQDNNDFQSILKGKPRASSTSPKLHHAYSILSDFVYKNKDCIDDLVDTLLNKFLLVKIHFPYDYIGHAFELINNRGKNLTQVELIKSHLFVQMELNPDMDEKQLDDLSAQWTEIVTNITGAGDKDIDSFIQHVLSLTNYGSAVQNSRNGQNKRNSTEVTKIYEVFLERIEQMRQEGDAAGDAEKEWLADIYEWHKVYCELRCPDNLREPHQSNLSAKTLLERIKDLRAVSIYPILLAGYYRYYENQSSKSDFVRLVDLCYRLHFNTMTLRDANEVTYRGMIQELARDLYSSETMSLPHVIKRLKKINAELTKGTPRLVDILGKKFTKTVSTQCLLLVEESKYGVEKIGYKPTIEHILPKKYNSNPKWKRYIKNHWEEDDEEYIKRYINDLGNQTLLSGNSNTKARNNFFREKFRAYNSDYNITRELADMEQWLPSDIEDRRAGYAEQLELALKIK